MDLVVREMSQITVPKDVLKQIDMRSLIEGLKTDYDKLGDLKVARQKHEDRNPFSRWWNSDELEGAQLDAAELQASFSKKLGQLMVISIEQSKLLTQQQNSIQEQQNKIKKQATELASANVQLDEQQQEQMQQQQKLEGLINDYFELKGLTAKDAEKLILIANEVKQMKKTIFDKLDHELSSINQIKDSVYKKFEQEVHVFNSKLDKHEIVIKAQLDKINSDFDEKFTEAKESFDESLKNLNSIMTQNYESLFEINEHTNLNISNIEIESQKKYLELNSELTTHQNLLEQNNSKIMALDDDFQSQQQQFENEITTKIEQLDLQYKQKLSDQSNIISAEQKQQQTALNRSSKQIRKLTVCLVFSLLIGAISIAFVFYPYLDI